MSFLSLIPVLGDILDRGLGIVDKLIPDKDKANELKQAIKSQILVQQHDENIKLLESQTKIITSEALGESPAQRNWRPHLMYLIMFILAFNGIIVPLGEAFFKVTIPTLNAWKAIPSEMWKLLMIGLGGYIGGRSAEKIFKTINTNK